MSGYDTKTAIENNWCYRELLEMIYLEELQAIQRWKEEKKQENIQELEDMLHGR